MENEKYFYTICRLPEEYIRAHSNPYRMKWKSWTDAVEQELSEMPEEQIDYFLQKMDAYCCKLIKSIHNNEFDGDDNYNKVKPLPDAFVLGEECKNGKLSGVYQCIAKDNYNNPLPGAYLNYRGNQYYYGIGETKDYEQAFRCYRKSAEMENSNAYNNLGNCYYYGNGVKKDLKTAEYYYSLAAGEGNEYGQYNLAYCNEQGNGNLYFAMNIYENAAKQGLAAAQYKLGIYNLERPSARRQTKEYYKKCGRDWLQKAAEQGYEPAIKKLGEIDG